MTASAAGRLLHLLGKAGSCSSPPHLVAASARPALSHMPCPGLGVCGVSRHSAKEPGNAAGPQSPTVGVKVAQGDRGGVWVGKGGASNEC